MKSPTMALLCAMVTCWGCAHGVDGSVDRDLGNCTGVGGLEIVNSIGMKLKLIKPGSFMMGGECGGEPFHQPVHKVTLTRAFYIGIHEVTQCQWIRVMGSNPSHFKRSPNLPVEQVNLLDAQEFCRKLSEMEKATYRLPTEAEWEYACRAGTTTDYHWGDDFGDKFDRRYAWKNPNPGDPHDPSEPDPHRSGEEGTQEVGGKLPNAWGLYDMSGNVWEMCEDRFSNSYGTRAEQIDPKGASADSPYLANIHLGSRVLRGGCWYSSAYECTSWIRSGYTPTLRIYNTGFRVVREVQ